MKALRKTRLLQVLICILISHSQIGHGAKKRLKKIQAVASLQDDHQSQAYDSDGSNSERFSMNDSLAVESNVDSGTTSFKEHENYPKYLEVENNSINEFDAGDGAWAAEASETPTGGHYENYVGKYNESEYYRDKAYKNPSSVPESYTGSVTGYYSPYYGYTPVPNYSPYPFFPNYRNIYNHYYGLKRRGDGASPSGQYGYSPASEPNYNNIIQNNLAARDAVTAYPGSEPNYVPAAAAPPQYYAHPGFSYARPVHMRDSGLGFMPEPARGLEFGGLAMGSGHRNSYAGHGGGWGWGKKGNGYHGGGHKKVQHVILKEKHYSGVDNGIGLLTLLSLLTLLTRNMNAFQNTTNSVNVASFGMTGVTTGRKKRSLLNNEMDNPDEGGFAKTESILLTVLPALNVIAQVRQGAIPMECVYQEVCNANMVISTELGLNGRYVASLLSSGINRLMEGKNNSPQLAANLKRAGLLGRNRHKCVQAYPTCLALQKGGTASVPLVMSPDQIKRSIKATSTE